MRLLLEMRALRESRPKVRVEVGTAIIQAASPEVLTKLWIAVVLAFPLALLAVRLTMLAFPPAMLLEVRLVKTEIVIHMQEQ